MTSEQEDGDTPSAVGPDQPLWIPWTIVLIGVWLVLSPSTFGYGNSDLWSVPSGGRGAWFSDSTHDSLRASLMTWSDVVSGALLVIFGLRMLRANRPITWWAACVVGVWLVFAPVVFWSPTASGYVNDSFAGMLIIALTILVPGMPNMSRFMVHGPAVPPGWSYNPSTWSQRSILIALGFAGLVVSRILGAYQLGYVDTVWDPFFGFDNGTRRVLNSEMSHTWPISDGGLGAASYSFEFLMGFMGRLARWRTMPWMVTFFGILVIPLGLSHIVLVMSQPVVVHEWCTLCLLAAAIMLPMITLTVDEVVAMGQHVRRAHRRGDRGGSWWKIFWLGGGSEDCTEDERSPEFAALPTRPWAIAKASVWGATAPWPLLASMTLGVVLLVAPSAFDVAITTGAADVAHIAGAAVIVVAVVAMAEVVRMLRLINVVVGLGAAVFVVVVGRNDTAYAATVAAVGVAVAALALPRGTIRERYGTWDRVVRGSETTAEVAA